MNQKLLAISFVALAGAMSSGYGMEDAKHTFGPKDQYNKGISFIESKETNAIVIKYKTKQNQICKRTLSFCNEECTYDLAGLILGLSDLRLINPNEFDEAFTGGVIYNFSTTNQIMEMIKFVMERKSINTAKWEWIHNHIVIKELDDRNLTEEQNGWLMSFLIKLDSTIKPRFED